jgi:hypothetical protein
VTTTTERLDWRRPHPWSEDVEAEADFEKAPISARVYWDEADPQNPGWYYDIIAHETHVESDPNNPDDWYTADDSVSLESGPCDSVEEGKAACEAALGRYLNE